MKKFKIPCPIVQMLKKHVLVMSFIGEDRVPAPKLKDARMSNSDLQKAYDQVVSVSDITSFKADAIVTIILSALKKDKIFLIFFNIVFSI